MKSKTDWLHRRQTLRTQAETLLTPISPQDPTAPPADVLLHELLVHKVELEMQIEELRRTNEAMEEARDRYLEFYDFAPVGYLTLNREGLIDAINLTGAAQLGVDRAKLLHRRFSRLVAAPERDYWHRLFMALMADEHAERQDVVLELIRGEAGVFKAYLDCHPRPATTEGSAPSLRLTLIDLDKIDRAAAARRAAGERHAAGTEIVAN